MPEVVGGEQGADLAKQLDDAARRCGIGAGAAASPSAGAVATSGVSAPGGGPGRSAGSSSRQYNGLPKAPSAVLHAPPPSAQALSYIPTGPISLAELINRVIRLDPSIASSKVLRAIAPSLEGLQQLLVIAGAWERLASLVGNEGGRPRWRWSVIIDVVERFMRSRKRANDESARPADILQPTVSLEELRRAVGELQEARAAEVPASGSSGAGAGAVATGAASVDHSSSSLLLAAHVLADAVGAPAIVGLAPSTASSTLRGENTPARLARQLDRSAAVRSALSAAPLCLPIPQSWHHGTPEREGQQLMMRAAAAELKRAVRTGALLPSQAPFMSSVFRPELPPTDVATVGLGRFSSSHHLRRACKAKPDDRDAELAERAPLLAAAAAQPLAWSVAGSPSAVASSATAPAAHVRSVLLGCKRSSAAAGRTDEIVLHVPVYKHLAPVGRPRAMRRVTAASMAATIAKLIAIGADSTIKSLTRVSGSAGPGPAAAGSGIAGGAGLAGAGAASLGASPEEGTRRSRRLATRPGAAATATAAGALDDSNEETAVTAAGDAEAAAFGAALQYEFQDAETQVVEMIELSRAIRTIVAGARKKKVAAAAGGAGAGAGAMPLAIASASADAAAIGLEEEAEELEALHVLTAAADEHELDEDAADLSTAPTSSAAKTELLESAGEL